ncbi:hypothetical protein Droror1_Dr00015703 [Drosera rotundifolia]
MSSDGQYVEGSLRKDLEGLSVSKRLARTVGHSFKRRNHKSQGSEEEFGWGVSFRCLSLFGRGGACRVGADTDEELGDNPYSRRSSTREEGKGGYRARSEAEETTFDCFPYGRKEKSWKKNGKRVSGLGSMRRNSRTYNALPDDILELCLMRLPMSSLMNARLVCKKWNFLAATPRFLKMRRDCSYQSPWLFLFGTVKDGYCSAEIHALDVSLERWHTVNSEILKGRFNFSVAGIRDEIFIVGGCSSLSNSGRVERSSSKTHKDVLVFAALTKSWHKVASMKYARSSPILGVSEVSVDFSMSHGRMVRHDRHVIRLRLGGVSDVYQDPHSLSVRPQLKNTTDGNENILLTATKQFRSFRQHPSSSNTVKDSRRFVLIAVGGLGSWDEPLDSGEIYDPASNKWFEIPKLPVDFGNVISGVACNSMFFAYSASNKLTGYDIERGYWFGIQTAPSPPRVHEYYPNLVSCNGRVFMLSVSWCEGDGQIGRRNKAMRKMWELDFVHLTWTEVSAHPDAPMDWNAAFVADNNVIFGVEMFKMFGQVLDFFTSCDVSDKAMKWKHVSVNNLAHEMDASSYSTKTMAMLHL